MSQIPVKLLVNGRVYSPTHPEATAMAVRGDVVAWLGSDDVGRDQFPDADVQDLDGRFVAPGFVDSHIHLTATGLMLSGLDLRPATSRAQCLRMVADYAADHPGQPLWGHGWDESAWPENAAPSTADLDAVLGDVPPTWPGSTRTPRWSPPDCGGWSPSWRRQPVTRPSGR